jgi:hypothetical protein
MFVLFCALLVTFTCAQPPPTPPDSFPPSWYTWVVTTVIEVGGTKPIYSVGQLVAFNMQQAWSCRLNQQDLVTPLPNRPVDHCDFTAGKHYELDSTTPGVTCSSTIDIENNLALITYPAEYLAAAVFFGIDRVNQKECNHFVATNIVIDDKNVQMDVWTSTDGNFPCQISVTDEDSTPRTITTWAFDGFGMVIPLDAVNQCMAAKLICAQPNWLCHPTAGATDQQLLPALNWVCDPTLLDCSPIAPGGEFYFPNTPRDHAKWAFNAYYLKNRSTQGPAACSFGGLGEIVPPPTQFLSQRYGLGSNSTRTFLQFSHDLTCERS